MPLSGSYTSNNAIQFRELLHQRSLSYAPILPKPYLFPILNLKLAPWQVSLLTFGMVKIQISRTKWTCDQIDVNLFHNEKYPLQNTYIMYGTLCIQRVCMQHFAKYYYIWHTDRLLSKVADNEPY